MNNVMKNFWVGVLPAISTGLQVFSVWVAYTLYAPLFWNVPSIPWWSVIGLYVLGRLLVSKTMFASLFHRYERFEVEHSLDEMLDLRIKELTFMIIPVVVLYIFAPMHYL